MNDRYVVYDLDGTLSSSAWRSALVGAPPRQWSAFFLLGSFDSYIPHTVNMLAADRHAGASVVIVSGRPASYELQVREWLSRHGIVIDELRMRQDDDFRSDETTKADIADQLIAEFGRPEKVVEDRRELDHVWVGRGIRIVRVADPALRPQVEILTQLVQSLWSSMRR